MEQILELAKTDDITAIRSRIEFAFPPPLSAEQKRLLLVAPRENQALQSLVNMKLLARLVKAKAVELAIVSDQVMVRDFAKEAQLKAFSNLNSAKRAGWMTVQTSVASPGQTLPPVVSPSHEKQDTPALKERGKGKKYVVVEGSSRIDKRQQLIALGLLLLLAVALVLGVVALVPQATVTLTPLAEIVKTDLVVKADPDAKAVDFKTLTFPARVAQVELGLYGEIKTVETELAAVGKATGEVTFINRTEEAQFIPFNTVVATSAGEQIEFTTVQTVTIPAGVGATATAAVVAIKPGPGGNVATGQINRFGQTSYSLLARVINERSLGGGTLEPAKVVVQADKERLEAHLRQKIQQEGYAKLQKSLSEQEFIPPDTVQVIVLDLTYKEFAGDFSETFGGEMQAVVRGTVIGGYNANRLALAALETQVPPGFKLDPKGLQFGAGEVLDVQGRSATFRILASGMVVPTLDAHEIAKEIAWLPVGEAQALLSQQYKLATVAGVELKPDWLGGWLGRLPYSPLRIQVVIKDAVTLMAKDG